MKQKKWIVTCLLLAAAVVFVLLAVSNLEQGRQRQDMHQLEQVLHRTAMACYAVEGAYPPDVDYMRQHYGLAYDESRYIVHYDVFASNFMPDITVMERNHEKE